MNRFVFLALAFLIPAGALAEAPATKRLRIYVDRPGSAGAPSAVFTGNLARRDFGHVFVELVDLPSGQTTGRKGFYPKNGVFPPFQSLDAGEIRNDYRRTSDASKEFALTDAQYDAARRFIESSVKAPPRFDLDHYNCVDWAMDVLRRAGRDVEVEVREIAVGDGSTPSIEARPLWRGLSPAALADALARDK